MALEARASAPLRRAPLRLRRLNPRGFVERQVGRRRIWQSQQVFVKPAHLAVGEGAYLRRALPPGFSIWAPSSPVGLSDCRDSQRGEVIMAAMDQLSACFRIEPSSRGSLHLVPPVVGYVVILAGVSYHSYMSHTHYGYEQELGREKFTGDVNRILERNGIAYNLEHGEVVRIAPAVLHETLASTVFKTGDAALDEMLEASRQKFLNRSLDVR